MQRHHARSLDGLRLTGNAARGFAVAPCTSAGSALRFHSLQLARDQAHKIIDLAQRAHRQGRMVVKLGLLQVQADHAVTSWALAKAANASAPGDPVMVRSRCHQPTQRWR